MDTININIFQIAKDLYNNYKYTEAFFVLNTVKDKDIEFYILQANTLFHMNEFSLCLKSINEGLNNNQDNQELLILKIKVYIKINELDKVYSLLNLIQDINIQNELLSIINKEKETINSLTQQFPNYIDYINFVKELYNRDCFINKMDIKIYNDSYRAVISKEQIKKNDILLRIPLKCLITLEMAKNSPIGLQITDDIIKGLNSPHHTILSTFLLEEFNKKEKSDWYFYFKVLPESYSFFPIFYTDDELNDNLKGTQFIQTVITKKKEILADYNLLCKHIKNYNKFPFELFCRTRMIIASRIFGVTIKGKKTDILAPYADMLNHKRPRETHWEYDNSEGSFVLSAIEDIDKGKEIFDSYGKKCNSRFLLNYGFTIENNEDNTFNVEVELKESYPFYEMKKMFLRGYKSKKYNIKKDIDDGQTYSLFSFLRFCLMDPFPKEKYTKIIKDISINPFDKKNEIMMLKELKLIMDNYLSKYPQTLEEDKILLNNNNLSYNQKNCCIMRISEKEVLMFYKNFAEYFINILNNNEKINFQNKNISLYNNYINQIIFLLEK